MFQEMQKVLKRKTPTSGCGYSLMVASGGVLPEGYGHAGLASALPMTRRRPKEYRRQVDATTRCSEVYTYTWTNLEIADSPSSWGLLQWIVTTSIVTKTNLSWRDRIAFNFSKKWNEFLIYEGRGLIKWSTNSEIFSVADYNPLMNFR